MHFLIRELVIKILFWHEFSTLNTFYQFSIRKVDNNNFQLQHTSIIRNTTFFGDPFRSFYFHMIILGCKYLPYLLCNCNKVIILLFFLIDNSIKIIIVIERDWVEWFVLNDNIKVDFTGVFFTDFFMLLLVIFREVVIPDILLPIFKPFGTNQVAVI